MALSEALLKKIAEARASAGGNNITDGRYVFEVHRVLVDAKFNGTMFILELGVVASEKTLPDVEPNKPGTTCSNAMNLDSNPSAPGNAKSFIMGLLGLTEDEADLVEAVGGKQLKRWVRELDRISSPEQPARGMLVGDETFRKNIRSGKNAGQPFTGHKWLHMASTPAEVAARRAAIDAGKVGTLPGGPRPAAQAPAAQPPAPQAPAPQPVPVADLEMDIDYSVDGRRMTFAGMSKGSCHFVEPDGQRFKAEAASLEGRVLALPGAAAR